MTIPNIVPSGEHSKFSGFPKTTQSVWNAPAAHLRSVLLRATYIVAIAAMIRKRCEILKSEAAIRQFSDRELVHDFVGWLYAHRNGEGLERYSFGQYRFRGFLGRWAWTYARRQRQNCGAHNKLHAISIDENLDSEEDDSLETEIISMSVREAFRTALERFQERHPERISRLLAVLKEPDLEKLAEYLGRSKSTACSDRAVVLQLFLELLEEAIFGELLSSDDSEKSWQTIAEQLQALYSEINP